LSAAFAHAAVDGEHGADDRSFLFGAQEERQPPEKKKAPPKQGLEKSEVWSF
jgi:hypothetical protein